MTFRKCKQKLRAPNASFSDGKLDFGGTRHGQVREELVNTAIRP